MDIDHEETKFLRKRIADIELENVTLKASVDGFREDMGRALNFLSTATRNINMALEAVGKASEEITS